MTDAHAQRSPFEMALAWLDENPEAPSAAGIAKLILSLWNPQCCFSLHECMQPLDDQRAALALRLVQHCIQTGDEYELQRCGRKVCDEWPELWELAKAGDAAKTAFLQQQDASSDPD